MSHPVSTVVSIAPRWGATEWGTAWTRAGQWSQHRVSFAGSLGRTTNVLWHDRPLAVNVIAVLAVPAILAAWWSAIVLWYLAFGLLLAPYRLLRRGSRKRKREARMHRETL
jgi:hypothetical protein